MSKEPIIVIGVGYSPLSEEKKKLILRAERLCLFVETVALLQRSCDEEFYRQVIRSKLEIVKSLRELVSKLMQTKDAIVIAGGDPLYFGLAETLKKKYGFEVKTLPDLSILQLACSKIGLPSRVVKSISFHGRHLEPLYLLNLVSRNSYVAVLTDEKNSIKSVAKALLDGGMPETTLHLFERLSFPEERYVKLSPKSALHYEVLSPHFLIVENQRAGKEQVFGLCEREFEHQAGLITKDEIRAVVLHSLRLPRKGIVWDVGAGSGSVGAEIAMLSPEIEVYAIEKDVEKVGLIEAKARRFYLPNLKAVPGRAPEILRSLPSPNRVFLGGSGGELERILSTFIEISTWEVLVATFAIVENFFSFLKFFSDRGFSVEAKQVNIARLSPLGQGQRLKPLNPTFVVRVERPKL